MAVALSRTKTSGRTFERRVEEYRHPRIAVLLVAGAVSWFWLVVRDGSPPWQLVRGAVVVVATVGALVGFTMWRQRQVGDTASTLGMTGVVVAVGFAPHVAKTGLSAASVAATTLLVASLFMVIGGVALAGRGRSRPARVVAAILTAATTAFTAWIVSPAIAATNVPRPSIGATPASAGLAYEDVMLRTSDGVDLAGWFVPPENSAAVVLLHGAGSTRSSVIEHAAAIARNGFGVLLVDARGHGESGGRAMDFGWHGDRDIEAATRFLGGQSSVDPRRIAVVGMSMGGEEAVGASASNPMISAVVAEGATARSAHDEGWLSDAYGWRGAIQEQLERVQDVATDVLTSASPPIGNRDAVRASGDIRYLLIAAGAVPEEQHAAAYVIPAAPRRVETWTVDGAGHTDGVRVAAAVWERRVVDFLRDALGVEAEPTEGRG